MAMNFRPSDELADKLKVQAEAEHTSVQNLLVKAAEEYLARHTRKAMLREGLEHINRDFGDALRRLGQ